MKTTKMTLARALRYKKRVVETIRKLESDIQESNCILEGEARETDVRLALKQRTAWVAHLVSLKLALQEGTKPIQKAIFEMAEAKAEIAFYQRISTEQGIQRSRYSGEVPAKFTSEIRKTEKDATIKSLQEVIDKHQTAVDAFNATTSVEIPEMDLP